MSEFNADRLPPEALAELQRLERQGRDHGAHEYLAHTVNARGAYRAAAEEAVVLDALAPRRDERVMDAGCGVGRHTFRVAPRVGSVLAVDFSTEALVVLEQEAAKRGLANITTLACAISELPAGVGRFDAVCACEVIQHVPSHAARLALLQRLRDALVEGGRAVVTAITWNGRSPAPKDGFWSNGSYRFQFTPAELRALLEEAGFLRVRVRPLFLTPGRIARLLPSALAPIETWASRLSFLAREGRTLLAVGQA